MKRFLIFFSLLWSICLSAGAQATSFTDLKFSQYQIADSQWNVSACMYTSTCQIYSTQPGTMYTIPWWNGQWSWQSGQYVQFSMTSDPANPYEGKVYNSNGSLAGSIGTGHIINMGVDASGKAMFFFVGNDNDTGQLFSTNAGLTGYSGYTWTGTLNPTTTQVNTFAVSYGSTTPLAAGQTASQNTAPTITGTSITYTYRNVVNGNTTTVYRTPVTTTTYSDGTSTSSNGSEALYQTKVSSTVVTSKVIGNSLITYSTPINTVTTVGGGTTIESNGPVTSTSQTVQPGLNYQVWRYDPKNYNCFLGICTWNFTYRTPSTNINNYGSPVRTGTTTNGMYLATNGRLPNGDNSWLGYNDGTVIRYTGTITAPITQNYPAGTVYRLYFYNQTDDGFVLKINGSQIINNTTTYQFQAIGNNYNGSGWMDVVAGQTYNLEAWYWNTDGGVGHRFFWDFGAGIMSVPNNAFTTGWITDPISVDTTGLSYSNGSVVNITGTSVSMIPSYVTTDGTSSLAVSDTVGSSAITVDQDSRVTRWSTATVVNQGIWIEQTGDNNVINIDQAGKSLIKGVGQDKAIIQGNANAITINQGVTGVGQNLIEMNVVGDNNVLSINQARTTAGLAAGGNGHYQLIDVNGYSNNLTTQQSNVGGVGSHYMETTIIGNNNSVIAKQTDNGNKIMFTSVNGNSNTADILQKGTGQHYLDLTMNGLGNTATILQEGTAGHKATVDLTRGVGGPNVLDLSQSGSNPLSIGIQQTCNVATCGAVTIRQTQ